MINRRLTLVEEILDFAEHGDYSNGIVGNDGTIDQGNVYARERIKEFRDRLNKLRSLESQCENVGHCGSTEGCGAEEIPAPSVDELDGLLLTISGVSDLKPAERKEAAAVIVDWLLSRSGQSAKPEWERAVDDLEARLKLELYSITMEYLKPHLAQMRSRLASLWPKAGQVPSKAELQQWLDKHSDSGIPMEDGENLHKWLLSRTVQPALTKSALIKEIAPILTGYEVLDLKRNQSYKVFPQEARIMAEAVANRILALSGSSWTVSKAEWDNLCLCSRNGVVILSVIREWLQSIGHPVEDEQ